MHEDGAAPPASIRPDTFRTATATAFFCPRITTSFLPTIAERPAASSEANIFCSAFETDRHAGLQLTESMCHNPKSVTRMTLRSHFATSAFAHHPH
jgi:hypothetical protein